MGCLSDMVGFRSICGGETATIDLSSLGITSKEIGDYMSADYASKAEFIESRKAWAEQVITGEVLSKYTSRIVPKTFASRGRIGERDESQGLLTATVNTIGGVMLEVNSPHANTRIDISSIDIWSDVGGEVTVTIYDLSDGTVARTLTLDTTADEVSTNAVSVQLPVYRRKARYFITTALPSYYTMWTHGGGCASCGSNGYAQGNLTARGARIAESAAMNYANLETQAHNSGLSVTAAVICDHAAWMCEIKELAVVPYAFKVAEEIVAFGLGNEDAFNARKGQNDDALAQRATMFNSKYNAAMDRLFQNMPAPSDSLCFDCSKVTRHVIVTP